MKRERYTSEDIYRHALVFIATVGGIGAGAITASVAISLRSDIKIIPPTNTLKTLFQYSGSIADPVNESIGASLAEQWEQYAKRNGFVNDLGEPIVIFHCEAKDNPTNPKVKTPSPPAEP